MSRHRAGLLGERVRTAAAGSVLLLVAWQALASLVEVHAELWSKPFERHVQALRASPEELVRLKLGPDFEILEALRRHVPRAAQMYVSFLEVPSGMKTVKRRTTWISSLIYPTVMKGWPFVPGREPSVPSPTTRQEYVLDLDSGRDFSAWPCEELARGRDFRLLSLGSEAR